MEKAAETPTADAARDPAAPSTAGTLADDELPVVPRRHIGRLIVAVILLALAALVLKSVFTNPRFQWNVVGAYLRDVSIGGGLWITIKLTVVCMLIGVVLGLVLAVLRLSNNPVVNGIAFGYITLFRGTPLLVQLLFWYNLAALYPKITFGLPGVALNANQLITPTTAAILGLGLNEAAYMSEIVRAGILSVEQGQSEASAALGLTRMQTMRRIILPQAMRVIVPPTGNETIGMLKMTSLVSVLAVPDLLYSAQLIYSRSFQTIPLLIVASIWYLVVTTILTIIQFYIERRFARGNRNLPPTPLQRVRTFFRTHAPGTAGRTA
ncbi:amino acid ABC transporter permease [Actinoallomurus acanthiterrae]